jgi:hypothetical protein
MTAAAHVRLVVWCKACGHRANLTRPSRHAGLAQRRQCLKGVGGWLARNAAAVMWTWW